jgi:hypothetical protein
VQTFWSHDPASREEDVLTGWRALAAHLAGTGIDEETQDELWAEAGDTFHVTCQELFGEDLVVAGQ